METDLNEHTHQQDLNQTPAIGDSNEELELEQQSAQIREAIYSFLSAVYLQPITEDTLKQICDNLFLNDLAEVLPSEATTELRRYLSELSSEDLTDAVTRLKQEFMSLFAVPTGRYVTPFEDIYRGKNSDGQPHRGPLLGVRAIAVKQIYREAGAEIDSVTKELPNHIGVELSFMRFLCEREAAALIDGDVIEQGTGQNIDDDIGENEDTNIFTQVEIYRAYQIRFLAEHLTRWFPELNEEIQKKSNHVFYQSIANITQQFLEQDLQILKTQLSNSVQ